MRARFNQLTVYWTWLLMIQIRPFLPDWHPYSQKHRFIPLKDWAAAGTPILYQFGCLSWMWVIVNVVVILLVLSRL